MISKAGPERKLIAFYLIMALIACAVIAVTCRRIKWVSIPALIAGFTLAGLAACLVVG
jgi:NAD/NADP transhydrogenase beta subunit